MARRSCGCIRACRELAGIGDVLAGRSLGFAASLGSHGEPRVCSANVVRLPSGTGASDEGECKQNSRNVPMDPRAVPTSGYRVPCAHAGWQKPGRRAMDGFMARAAPRVVSGLNRSYGVRDPDLLAGRSPVSKEGIGWRFARRGRPIGQSLGLSRRVPQKTSAPSAPGWMCRREANGHDSLVYSRALQLTFHEYH